MNNVGRTARWGFDVVGSGGVRKGGDGGVPSDLTLPQS
jgi:hypothetical protein